MITINEFYIKYGFIPNEVCYKTGLFITSRDRNLLASHDYITFWTTYGDIGNLITGIELVRNIVNNTVIFYYD